MTPLEHAVARLQQVLSPAHTEACRAELAALGHRSLAERIERGDLSAVIGLHPTDGRDESALLSPGAAPRCADLARTLTAGWYLEQLLALPPAALEGQVTVAEDAVATGDLVPITGLWVDSTGCPNLLLGGTVAPEHTRAAAPVSWPDGVSDYETVTEPTTWRRLEIV